MFSVPLSDNDLIEFINDQTKVYDVKYTPSLEDNIIVYLANLNIKCNLFFDNDTDRLSFIKNYMTTDSFCSIPNINEDVIKILLFSVGLRLDNFDISLSDELILKFITENKDLIHTYQMFLDSLVLFAFSTITKKDNITKKLYNFDNVEEIDDTAFIGVNVVNLLSYKELYFYYFKHQVTKCYNLKHQFEDYMFNGENLFHYFYTENNIIEKIILKNVCDTK